MDIYIKLKKKSVLKNKNIAKIKDIAEIIGPKNIEEDIKEIIILKNKNKTNYYLISVLEIIKVIKNKNSQITVNSVGEVDTVVEFKKNNIFDNNKFLQFIKIFIVSIILAIGSSTAIMSFHNDSQMYQIFKNYKKIFLNNENASIFLVEVPYSIGLAVGIIVFYNHFACKKITKDPTPLEVEMSLYEEDVVNTVKENLQTENESSNREENDR